MNHNVLIIEDNSDIAHLVQLHLKDIQCKADIAPNAHKGLQLSQQKAYSLVVLDLMLPGMNGLTVCQELRRRPGYIPILVLTAKSSELDRVVSLEIGANDYLTKPFSILELQARIKALLRRVDALAKTTGLNPQDGRLMRKGLTIDIAKRQVKIVDLHHAKISASSDIELGTLFCFSVPIASLSGAQ